MTGIRHAGTAVRALAAALLLLVAACDRPVVVVGAKDFSENRILAEMISLRLEEAGMRVERRFRLGDTTDNFEALRRGAVDVYPEYTGTALSLLGRPPTADREQAWIEVQSAFGALDMRFLPRFGFQSTYAILVRAETAARDALETVSDLEPVAGTLRLGATETYAERPRDGLWPLLDRFGLDFAEVEIVPGNDRASLYAALVEKRLDVIVGYATDPQIRDFGLETLRPDEPFFPAYDSAPLVRDETLARLPAMEPALVALGGRIDEALIRRLNKQVEIDGRSVRGVAAQALAELELLDEPQADPAPPLAIAAEHGALGGDEANAALRAVRRAMPGRGVSYVEANRPISLIRGRRARIALVPSIAQFRILQGRADRISGFETIAAVGSSFVHALTPKADPATLAEARRIATGPAGSSSHRLGDAILHHLGTAAELVPLEDTAAGTAARALAEGRADVSLVVAAPGRPDVSAVLGEGSPLTLTDAAGWWRGPSRLALPFLREAKIPADLYPAPGHDTATLAMQLTLVGPAPPRRTVIGRQGPSSYTEELYPLTDAVVLAINENLGLHLAVDPALRSAAALGPDVRGVGDRLNPRPDQAYLSVAILAFLVWVGWLVIRRPQGPGA